MKEKLYPVATGPAAEIVAAHQAPQSIEFYSGYCRLIRILILAGSVRLFNVYGLLSRRENSHINTRKLILTRRRYLSVPTTLRRGFIFGNQSQRTRSGKCFRIVIFNQQSLIDDGKILYESSIIVEYLNDQYDLGLLPKDPYERAKGKLVIDIINKKIIPAYFRTLQMQELDQQASGKADFIAGLKEFAEKLPKDDGPFYEGKNFGFVDIELVPWILRYHI